MTILASMNHQPPHNIRVDEASEPYILHGVCIKFWSRCSSFGWSPPKGESLYSGVYSNYSQCREQRISFLALPYYKPVIIV